MANREVPVHRWVPWIAGYSRHFVEDAISRYTSEPGVVLDPFAGVGTTLVEADLAGHEAVGFEINPYAAFASRAKLNAHHIDSGLLLGTLRQFIEFIDEGMRNEYKPLSVPPKGFRTRAPFYSPRVEHKVLLTLDFISRLKYPLADFYRLAFAATMVHYSNYSYEPSLGRKVTVGRPEVDDHDVAQTIASKVRQMAEDAAWYRKARDKRFRKDGQIIEKSFLSDYSELEEGSVDLLVTSPPYLNNYHYNRNTRPHLYWLGFCSTIGEMKRLEELNFGTYWQNARSQEHVELDPEIEDRSIRQTLARVRRMNPEKGIYGGRGWANYAAQYFNDCAKFVAGAAWCLRRGGTALVVIGNSILQGVPIPTDQYLASIASSRGFEVVKVHVPRDTRVGNSILNSSVRAGKTKGSTLYESVVELRCL